MKTRRFSIKERVGQYRARMQDKGFRQVNLWLPDTRSPSFARECRRQSLLVAGADRKDGILDALDEALRDTEGWR
ncbi:MAG: antitoxin MazE family protein [Nevskiales bacterium]